jgi:hypothetical protein
MYFNFMTHKLIYNSFIQVDRIFLDKKLEMYPPLIFNLYEFFLLKNVKLYYTPAPRGYLYPSPTPAPRRGRGVYCFTSVRPPVHPSVRPRYFSSHFSQ